MKDWEDHFDRSKKKIDWSDITSKETEVSIRTSLEKDDVGALRKWMQGNDIKKAGFIYDAAERGKLNCLSFLLKHKPEPFHEGRLLRCAVQSGRVKIVEQVLLDGMDPNIPVNSEGDTAVHIAVKHGLSHIVDFLETKGVSLNRSNLQGQTPLHLAILNDDVKLLKKSRKRIKKEDQPEDLLSFAQQHKKKACVKELKSTLTNDDSIDFKLKPAKRSIR